MPSPRPEPGGGGAGQRILPGRFLLLAAALASAAPLLAAEGPGTLLANYSFDDDVPTGPDTFRIFQYSKGTVRLTSTYHVSGYRAIELRDVAGDKSMPEIQGYFPAQAAGSALLRTSRSSPRRPRRSSTSPSRAPDGSSWRRTRSLSGSRRTAACWSTAPALCREEAVSPRGVRLVLRRRGLRRGRGPVRLEIRQEGRNDPLVALVRQRNAPGRQGSAVDKFSFVGEPLATPPTSCTTSTTSSSVRTRQWWSAPSWRPDAASSSSTPLSSIERGKASGPAVFPARRSGDFACRTRYRRPGPGGCDGPLGTLVTGEIVEHWTCPRR